MKTIPNVLEIILKMIYCFRNFALVRGFVTYNKALYDVVPLRSWITINSLRSHLLAAQTTRLAQQPLSARSIAEELRLLAHTHTSPPPPPPTRTARPRVEAREGKGRPPPPPPTIQTRE